MSRRLHTAHDLASLRIDLFGETAKSSSSQVFGRKARGTVDKRGNVLATAPFRRGKRKAIERDSTTQGSPGEPTTSTVNEETLESGRPRKRRPIYYPSILPFLDISESTDTPISRLGNGQPTADVLKRIHRFACEYYSERGMLYDASQGTRAPTHGSSTRRIKDKGGTPMAEFEPTPAADLVHDEDGPGVHHGVELNTATADKSLQKNMFRAFDGTALITIGMLLQEHTTNFLQRPPMDQDEWCDILLEESEKEKRRGEWKMKRSKSRKDKPQVRNKAPEEGSTSGSGSEDDESITTRTDTMMDEEEGPSNERVEEVIVVDHDSLGTSPDSRPR